MTYRTIQPNQTYSSHSLAVLKQRAKCHAVRPACRNCGRCDACGGKIVREDPRVQPGAPALEPPGTWQTLGAAKCTVMGGQHTHENVYSGRS